MSTTADAVAFYPLTISDVTEESNDAVAITFLVPPELAERFTHIAGQHVVLKRDINGEDVRRSYSICSAPITSEQLESNTAASFTVGIKQIPDGVFSTFATQSLKPGDTLEVLPPIGEFYIDASESGAHHVLVGAGSGITPLLSIAYSALESDPASTVSLIYGNRGVSSIMFLDEIVALKDRFPTRFQVLHIFSREANEVELFQGRIDAAKIKTITETLLNPQSVDHWYLCGPLEMVEVVQETLGSVGVAPNAIHTELFFDERIETVELSEADHESLAKLTVTINGSSSVVYADPNGPAILDYARSVRAEVPFACKGGMCATCKAVVVSGEVTMQKNYALNQEQVEGGEILTCQARPANTEDLHISFDTHAGIGR